MTLVFALEVAFSKCMQWMYTHLRAKFLQRFRVFLHHTVFLYNNIDQTLFSYTLTFAEPLGRSWHPRLSGSDFQHLPRGPEISGSGFQHLPRGPEISGSGFQHLPQGPANVNAQTIMFNAFTDLLLA